MSAALAGCAPAIQPIAVALAGAGTSSAISHTLDGTAYRTFTAPLEEVQDATLDSLSLMGIQVERIERPKDGTVLVRASAIRRSIEIELEPISAKATRMRVEAKNGGVLYDGATATEIVLQTQQSLGLSDVTNSSYGSTRARR